MRSPAHVEGTQGFLPQWDEQVDGRWDPSLASSAGWLELAPLGCSQWAAIMLAVASWAEGPQALGVSSSCFPSVSFLSIMALDTLFCKRPHCLLGFPS